MIKHTPGPWMVHSDATDRASFVRRCRVVSINKDTGQIIRIASTDISIDVQAKEKEANARLISAAPKLLMFLKDVIDSPFLAEDEAWIDVVKNTIDKIAGQ